MLFFYSWKSPANNTVFTMQVNVATLSAQNAAQQAAEYAAKLSAKAVKAREAANGDIEHIAHRMERTTSSTEAVAEATRNAAPWADKFQHLSHCVDWYGVLTKTEYDDEMATRLVRAVTVATWRMTADMEYEAAAKERAAIAKNLADIAEKLAVDAKRVAEELAADAKRVAEKLAAAITE